MEIGESKKYMNDKNVFALTVNTIFGGVLGKDTPVSCMSHAMMSASHIESRLFFIGALHHLQTTCIKKVSLRSENSNLKHFMLIDCYVAASISLVLGHANF